jgi:hypothetical protein
MGRPFIFFSRVKVADMHPLETASGAQKTWKIKCLPILVNPWVVRLSSGRCVTKDINEIDWQQSALPLRSLAKKC